MSERDKLESYIAHLKLTIIVLVDRMGGEVVLADQDLANHVEYVLEGEENDISKQVTLRVRPPLFDGGPAPVIPPLSEER